MHCVPRLDALQSCLCTSTLNTARPSSCESSRRAMQTRRSVTASVLQLSPDDHLNCRLREDGKVCAATKTSVRDQSTLTVSENNSTRVKPDLGSTRAIGGLVLWQKTSQGTRTSRPLLQCRGSRHAHLMHSSYSLVPASFLDREQVRDEISRSDEPD
jgi:hypothetical protein